MPMTPFTIWMARRCWAEGEIIIFLPPNIKHLLAGIKLPSSMKYFEGHGLLPNQVQSTSKMQDNASPNRPHNNFPLVFANFFFSSYLIIVIRTYD